MVGLPKGLTPVHLSLTVQFSASCLGEIKHKEEGVQTNCPVLDIGGNNCL